MLTVLTVLAQTFCDSLPCVAAAPRASDPHNLTFTQPSGLGGGVSDEFTVPVWRVHDRGLYRAGEKAVSAAADAA
jgi:hypothetical protein